MERKSRIKLSSPKLQGAHAKGDSNINNDTLLPIDSNQILSPTISPKSLGLTPLESSPIGSPFLVPQQVKMPMIGSKKSSDSPADTCSKPLTVACPSRTPRPTKSTVPAIGSTEKNLISSSIIVSSCDYDDEALAAMSQVNPALSSPMNPIRAEKSASPFMIDTKDCNPQQPQQQQQQQYYHHQHQPPVIKSAIINRRHKHANANGMKVVGHSNSSLNRRGVSVSPSPSKKEPLEDKLDKYQLHIFGRGVSFSVSTLLPIMFYVAIGTIAVIALAFIHEWHSSITNLVYAGRSTIEANSHMFRRELSGRVMSAVLNLMESAGSATKVISNTFTEDYLSKVYIEDDIGRFSDAFVRVYSAYNEFSTMAIVTQHSGAEHMFIVQRLDNSGGIATYGAIDGDRTTVTKMFFYDADFTPTQRLAGINETSFEAIPFWSRRNATSEPMLWFMSKSSSALRSQSDVLIGFIQKIHRKEDGSLLAVVSTGFTAHRISNILSSLPLTKNSMVFIISSAPPYKFIAGKNIEPLAYDPTNFSAFEHPSDIVRETTKVWAAANGFAGGGGGDALADNHGDDDSRGSSDSSYDDPNEFLVCDGTIIVNARRINNSYNMDLTLFILVPKDDVVGPVVAQYTRFSRTYSSIIGCFVCITAFACVTSHYFGRKFSNKCKSIAKSLENIISLDESDVYTDTSDTVTVDDSDDDAKFGGMSPFHLNDSTGPRSERTFSNGSSDPDRNVLTGSDSRTANENLCKCGRRHKQVIGKNASDTKDGDKKEPAKSLIGPRLSSLQMSFASYFSSPRLPPAPGSEISSGIIVREIHEMDKSVSRVSRMVKNFARYIPLPVVRMYMKNRKSPELKLDSQHAVIMFLDIANFTWLSEQLGDAMISALNKLFEEFSNILIEYGAVIDKYMGDAIMALWNVPEEIDMPEARAAKAAIRIIQRLDQLNEDYFPSNYGCTMGLRIGLNCGDVYAGNVGVPQRMNYTVLGNNVNIAARLEPLNKELGTRILVTDSFRRACSGSCLGADVMFRCLGATCLRGMKSPVVVHQVLGDPEFVPVVIAMKLGVYRAIDSVLIECARGIRPASAAREAYEKYLSVNGDDKAIRYFYDHLD